MRHSGIIFPLAALVTYAACSDGGQGLLAPEPEAPQAPQATHVAPIFVEGNKSCAQLGYGQFEFKLEPVASGTYSLPNGRSLTVTVNNTANGQTFDWSSTRFMDAVFAKGGPDGNLYVYDPEANADQGLHAPVNSSNGNYYGLSHISFCWDPDPNAKISITPDGVNEVGDRHTFTAHVDVDPDDGSGWANAPDGTVISFSTTGTGTFYEVGTTNPATTCTTSGGTGSCQIDLVNASVGTDVVTASTTLTVAGQSLTRSTDGTGGNSGPASKYWVDASIGITPLTDTNGITESHVFTITFTAYPGSATPTTFNSITPSISPTPDSYATTCGTPTVVDDVATCTVTISHSSVATFTLNASGSVTVGADQDPAGLGVTLLRDTDPATTTTAGPGGSGPATKTYVDGSLRWFKHDNQGQLLGGAVFTVCRTHDYDSGTGTFVDVADVCFDVSDDVDGVDGPAGAGLDQDGTGGEFQLDGLILGTYSVQEKTPPAGYTGSSLVQTTPTGFLSTTNTSYTFSTAWVNTPQNFEGCTPGFWKNHTSLWDQNGDQIAGAIFSVTGYYGTTSARFKDVFGIGNMRGLSNNLTLGEAINLGGGDFNKLARHGTAALLNAASDQTNYPLSVSQVVLQVREAFANNTPEPLATQLDQYNNLGCDAQ